MATGGRSYVVRDAGTESRLGRVYKIYPYTLKALGEALEEARFRSYSGPPQVVTVVRDRQSTVIRRYENGREVPVPPLPARWERACGRSGAWGFTAVRSGYGSP